MFTTGNWFDGFDVCCSASALQVCIDPCTLFTINLFLLQYMYMPCTHSIPRQKLQEAVPLLLHLRGVNRILQRIVHQSTDICSILYDLILFYKHDNVFELSWLSVKGHESLAKCHEHFSFIVANAMLTVTDSLGAIVIYTRCVRSPMWLLFCNKLKVSILQYLSSLMP